MYKILKQIPIYGYLTAGLVGATVSYLFYEPTYFFIKSASNKKKLDENQNPRGLINHRNECFMNVILQSLASSSKVVEWLVLNKPQSSSLFDTLSKTITLINRLESTNSIDYSDYSISQDTYDFYAANSVKKALNQHNWHIRPSDEHDCHEFFHLIMDVLDDELNEMNISNKSLNFFQPTNLSSNSNTKRIKNPFHGYIVVSYECLDCNYKYPLKLESFYSLSLMIPQKPAQFWPPTSANKINQEQLSTTTLYECINNYFRNEILVDMKCENCKESTTKKQGFIKRQAIAKLPESLCIQIQRNSWSDSTYGMIKQTSYVKFPLAIKIDDGVSPSPPNSMDELRLFQNSLKSLNNQFSLKQVGLGGLVGGQFKSAISTSQSYSKKTSQASRAVYELKSAVVHYGSANSGHFVVYRKQLNDGNDSNNWLMISDNNVKLVNESSLLNSNVYMLFYDKISPL